MQQSLNLEVKNIDLMYNDMCITSVVHTAREDVAECRVELRFLCLRLMSHSAHCTSFWGQYFYVRQHML